MVKRRVRLSSSDRLRMVEMYEGGMSLRQIAPEFGVTHAGVHKVLVGLGVDTRKGGINLWRVEDCTWCGVSFGMNRARWRERRRLGRFFCNFDCYMSWVKEQGSHYKVSRYGQRAARRKVESILGVDLPEKAVVHHIDGDCLENDVGNLMLFSSHSDHMKWHRGDRNSVVPLWSGACD